MASSEWKNRLIFLAIGLFVVAFGGLMLWLGLRWGQVNTLTLEEVLEAVAKQNAQQTAQQKVVSGEEATSTQHPPDSSASTSPIGLGKSSPPEVQTQQGQTRPSTSAETKQITSRSASAESSADKLRQRQGWGVFRSRKTTNKTSSTPGADSSVRNEEALIAVSSAGSLATERGPMASPLVKKSLQTLILVILAYLLMFFLINLINRHVRDVRQRHSLRKNVVYLINILLVASILLIWLQNISYLTILLGFASAGLALALQEVILCVAGWLMILIRRPFDTGDRIEINGVRGDVIDIRLFQTSLLEIGNWVDSDQSTGRIVNIPNSFVFKYPNFNYNRGFDFIWNEIPILVTFESDWKKAHDIILKHGQEYAAGLEEEVTRKLEIMKNRYMIYYGKLTPIVYVNIKDSGVELTLRYLTEAKKRRSSQDKICRGILEDFNKEPTVDFAYPTYRIVRT